MRLKKMCHIGIPKSFKIHPRTIRLSHPKSFGRVHTRKGILSTKQVERRRVVNGFVIATIGKINITLWPNVLLRIGNIME